jgi:hypothetical protein
MVKVVCVAENRLNLALLEQTFELIERFGRWPWL